MATMKEAVEAFLAQKRIAVAGVSRNKNEAANIVYRKLRSSGYEVFAVNPNAETVEGDSCYPDLRSVPGGVDGVVIATRPDVTEHVVRECAELGVPRVWMHRSFGEGSVSEGAVEYCREKGIDVIAGGCPMMFCQPVDFGHKCMRWILNLTGGLPKEA
jgi:predicted CoA-binding protein